MEVRFDAIVERYSTTFEDTSDISYGLGCGDQQQTVHGPRKSQAEGP
jgi:hypothetical protein